MALTTNLVNYWKMDEASSATRVDSIGSNNLTNNGAVNAGTGIINNGATNWSAANFLDAATSANWSFTAAFSVNFWLRSSTWSAGNRAIIVKNGAGAGDGWSIYMQGSGGSLLFQRDGIDNYISNSSLSTNTWYMYTFTCSGAAGTMHIYRNAVSDFTPVTINSPSSNTNTLQIGKNRGAGAGNPLDPTAVLDELGIWTRELSLSEVTELYNGGVGLQYPFVATSVVNNLSLMGVGA